MSATPKKTPMPGNNVRRPSANSPSSTGAPSRSPSRMATTAAPTPPAGLARARSVRAGTPVSARAAARKPATNSSAPTDIADEDARAEVAAQLDDLRERLQQAEQATEDSHRQTAVLQVKLDDALKEQGILEESVHEHTERIEEMDNERRETLRARRELELIYEYERSAAMKEREEVQAREEELQGTIQRLKETLTQRDLRAGLDDERRPSMSRNSSFRNSASSPNPESARQFAPSSSLQRSDSRSSSKLVMEKDRIIESLRLELAEAQIKLVEVENQGGGRLQELEKSLYETKMQNGRLMEENESFQLLLSEKTLNGDFAHSDFLRPPSNSGSRPPSRHVGSSSLADELEAAGEDQTSDPGENRRLHTEVSSLKDQNKALTLYINNIISRLLQHDAFEQILDKTPDLMAGPGAASRRFADANTDKDLPPPPPEKDMPAPSGFLQRARSVVGGKSRPRPLSQVAPAQSVPPAVEPTLNENPVTAPSVPPGRSSSTRGGSAGHRRANSEWSHAAVVGNMYHGPSPGSSRPLSPGLVPPRPFFSPPALNPSQAAGGRVPSGSSVPTISENEGNKENLTQTQRDSKISSSRNSVTSNPSNSEGEVRDFEASNPSSPPQSTTSSGDRDRPSGAIMMGTKMRPLRLVQEAAEDDAAKKAANRGSWFGWMNKGQRSVSGETVPGRE